MKASAGIDISEQTIIGTGDGGGSRERERDWDSSKKNTQHTQRWMRVQDLTRDQQATAGPGPFALLPRLHLLGLIRQDPAWEDDLLFPHQTKVSESVLVKLTPQTHAEGAY